MKQKLRIFMGSTFNLPIMDKAVKKLMKLKILFKLIVF